MRKDILSHIQNMVKVQKNQQLEATPCETVDQKLTPAQFESRAYFVYLFPQTSHLLFLTSM